MKEGKLRCKIIKAMLDEKISISAAVAMQRYSGRALYYKAQKHGIV